MQPFLDRQVMLADGDRYLSLAVQLTDPAEPRHEAFTGLLYARQLSGQVPEDLRVGLLDDVGRALLGRHR